jgi:hypothetical protein
MSAAGQKEDEVMPEVVDDYVNLPFDGQDDKSRAWFTFYGRRSFILP